MNTIINPKKLLYFGSDLVSTITMKRLMHLQSQLPSKSLEVSAVCPTLTRRGTPLAKFYDCLSENSVPIDFVFKKEINR